MKQARKRRSLNEALGVAENFFRNLFVNQPRDWLLILRERLRDLPKTNFDLGCDFAEQGQWHDAMFRFRITRYLQPKYPQALYNLACCYVQLGRTQKAREALVQVLSEHPAHTEAIFMLGAIDPSALTAQQRPSRIPLDLVTRFFSSIAENYNQLEAANQYRGGVAMAEQLKPLLPATVERMIDLGCGTGIAAIPYRAAVKELIGVDVTPAMVAQAASQTQGDTKLFAQVIEADITTPLEALPAGAAEVVLLVNVTPFLGELTAVLTNTARMLKPDGVFAMTYESYSGQAGFGLMAGSGRFGHSAAYVKQVAASAGLVAVKQGALSVYNGRNAEFLIFRSAGAAA